MSTLLDKFPGLARYADPVTAQDDDLLPPPDAYAGVYIDALQKTDAAARLRYPAAFFAGINFINWGRTYAGLNFAEYEDRGSLVDDLWVKNAPIEMFTEALRQWARAYLGLAQACHRYMIAEINQDLSSAGAENATKDQ